MDEDLLSTFLSKWYSSFGVSIIHKKKFKYFSLNFIQKIVSLKVSLSFLFYIGNLYQQRIEKIYLTLFYWWIPNDTKMVTEWVNWVKLWYITWLKLYLFLLKFFWLLISSCSNAPILHLSSKALCKSDIQNWLLQLFKTTLK